MWAGFWACIWTNGCLLECIFLSAIHNTVSIQLATFDEFERKTHLITMYSYMKCMYGWSKYRLWLASTDRWDCAQGTRPMAKAGLLDQTDLTSGGCLEISTRHMQYGLRWTLLNQIPLRWISIKLVTFKDLHKIHFVQTFSWLNREVTDATRAHFQNRDGLVSFQHDATAHLIIVYPDSVTCTTVTRHSQPVFPTLPLSTMASKCEVTTFKPSKF